MREELFVDVKFENQIEMFEAFARSDFYQFLVRSIQFPTIELAEAMIDGRFMLDGISILKELTKDEKDFSSIFDTLSLFVKDKQNSRLLFTEMRQEYTRLFNHPTSALLPIYETTFLTRDLGAEVLFISPTALDVEQAYQEAGVRLMDESKEPADHLGIQLEFMMYLYLKKGQLIHKQEEESLLEVIRQIDEFEEKHIRKWVYDFFEKLEKLSPNSPYCSIAQFAKSGLESILDI